MDQKTTGPELIVSSLGSGSNGNAFLVEFDSTRVLIDSGVPIRTLISCLAQRFLTPADLTAVLISHEHIDHVRSIEQLQKRSNVPVLATTGTIAGLVTFKLPSVTPISAGSMFQLGSMEITPVSVSHDAHEPVGFFIQSMKGSVSLFTDLGEYNDENLEYASRADLVVIESNYDEGMLRTGPYPAHLKRRIRSADGHLSNDECAAFLSEAVTDRTSDIWLCHLSENNNRPERATETSTSTLTERGIHRSIVALPRYDGTVQTWRSSTKSQPVQQSRLWF
jgi:phosphoribosyl 1,2-cyclic phosphodiesterase